MTDAVCILVIVCYFMLFSFPKELDQETQLSNVLRFSKTAFPTLEVLVWKILLVYVFSLLGQLSKLANKPSDACFLCFKNTLPDLRSGGVKIPFSIMSDWSVNDHVASMWSALSQRSEKCMLSWFRQDAITWPIAYSFFSLCKLTGFVFNCRVLSDLRISAVAKLQGNSW